MEYTCCDKKLLLGRSIRIVAKSGFVTKHKNLFRTNKLTIKMIRTKQHSLKIHKLFTMVNIKLDYLMFYQYL